jgi:3-oxoadipate enol-lactonase
MEPTIVPGRLSIGQFSLYYERVGQGSASGADALVFLHGLGGNHLSWWQQVPYFMRWFDCITVDQRGFGLSPDPEGLFNQAHPGDLGRLLDELRIEKAVLIGQSMGGWTIVGYALEHPERVAGMVMADTYGGIVTPEMAQAFRSRTLRPLPDPPAIGSMPTYALDYFKRRPEMAFLYDALRILGARPPADAMLRIGARRYDLAAVRERLTMPVLCLVGEEDELIPPATIAMMVRALPNARMATVPHCGHSIYFERPEVFNQLVLGFLREIGYGRTSPA